ncbi:hypothetical protein C9374_002863 [Naegleria lovaniensis]|uniref:Spindle assembly checkpoint component MAD1 n=1 Tax=Naegleria lovaniensis TaxID=51637 RepID=A0AA88GSV7_NAELO|nr:uncharacterized protein C9374_002863 [Naegleria lovaniensis]KAG2386417.1 hypothetical protein C9374_002863 [Naegleria lovaniensis]
MFAVFEDENNDDEVISIQDENNDQLESNQHLHHLEHNVPQPATTSSLTHRLNPSKVFSDSDRTENLPPSVMQALNNRRLLQQQGSGSSGSSGGNTRPTRTFGAVLSTHELENETNHNIHSESIQQQQRNDEEEEDHQTNPFDKYWNIQLPPKPSSSLSGAVSSINTSASTFGATNTSNLFNNNSSFMSSGSNVTNQRKKSLAASSSSISNNDHNTTRVSSMNTNSGEENQPLKVLQSPMASHLLSPSVRKAISSIYNENNETSISGSSSSSAKDKVSNQNVNNTFHIPSDSNITENTENNFIHHVHNTFGTRKRKSHLAKSLFTVFDDSAATSTENQTTVATSSENDYANEKEKYLFGDDTEDEEIIREKIPSQQYLSSTSPSSRKDMFVSSVTSPLKKRKMTTSLNTNIENPSQTLITNQEEEEGADQNPLDSSHSSLNISPPPVVFGSENAENILFSDHVDDTVENQEKPSSPHLLEAGLYTGRSRDRKSRIQNAYLESNPMQLSPIPNSVERNQDFATSRISHSPLLKYTIPSRGVDMNLSSFDVSNNSALNISIRERDEIIDQLNNESENDRKKIREMKVIVDKWERENSHLRNQTELYKKQYEELLNVVELESQSKNDEITKLHEQILEQNNAIQELQHTLNSQKDLMIAEVETKLLGIDKTVEALKSDIVQKDIQIDALERQNMTLQTQIEETHKSRSEAIQKSQSQQREYDMLSQKHESLVFKISQQEKKLEELNTLESEIKNLRNEISQRNDEKKRIRELETELQKAQLSLESQELLKEKIRDLESQLLAIETLTVQNEKLSSKTLELESLLKKWEQSFVDCTPADVDYKLKTINSKCSRLEERIQDLLIEKNDLSQHVQRLTSEITFRESDIAQLRSENQLLQDKLTNAEVKLFGAKKQLESATKFAHINDKEEAFSSNSAEDEKNSYYLQRITSLEQIIEEKDAIIKTLADKMESLQITVTDKQTSLETLEKEFERINTSRHEYKQKSEDLQQQVEKLQKLRDELENEIARYEQKLGRGEYNKDKVKILHMKLNPETEAKKSSSNDVERLKTENKLLNDELETLRQQLERSGTAIHNEQEIVKLKEENADAQRRITKLKEVFQKKINEFRKSVYLLFGFRVDVIETNRFRLSSMYAESPEDYLLFESDGNAMKLLSSEFACSIDEKIMKYLSQFRSIPGFLSSLTMDLFNKQTVFTQ